MVDALKEAGEAIRSLWTGLCNIFSYQEVDDKYGITEHKEVKLHENIPCRLSFKNISQANQTDSFAKTDQVVKLFIAPEVYVPPGSIVEVSQNGVTGRYEHSGVSAIYTNHQEIILDNYKERA